MFRLFYPVNNTLSPSCLKAKRFVSHGGGSQKFIHNFFSPLMVQRFNSLMRNSIFRHKSQDHCAEVKTGRKGRNSFSLFVPLFPVSLLDPGQKLIHKSSNLKSRENHAFFWFSHRGSLYVHMWKSQFNSYKSRSKGKTRREQGYSLQRKGNTFSFLHKSILRSPRRGNSRQSHACFIHLPTQWHS